MIYMYILKDKESKNISWPRLFQWDFAMCSNFAFLKVANISLSLSGLSRGVVDYSENEEQIHRGDYRVLSGLKSTIHSSVL